MNIFDAHPAVLAFGVKPERAVAQLGFRLFFLDL